MTENSQLVSQSVEHNQLWIELSAAYMLRSFRGQLEVGCFDHQNGPIRCLTTSARGNFFSNPMTFQLHHRSNSLKIHFWERWDTKWFIFTSVDKEFIWCSPLRDRKYSKQSFIRYFNHRYIYRYIFIYDYNPPLKPAVEKSSIKPIQQSNRTADRWRLTWKSPGLQQGNRGSWVVSCVHCAAVTSLSVTWLFHSACQYICGGNWHVQQLRQRISDTWRPACANLSSERLCCWVAPFAVAVKAEEPISCRSNVDDAGNPNWRSSCCN